MSPAVGERNLGSVGAAIVVGGRESRPRGEGRQGMINLLVGTNRRPRKVGATHVKPKGDREPAATPVLRMMIPGEPGAVKAARRVRRGARRNLHLVGGTAVKHPDDKQGAPRLPNLTAIQDALAGAESALVVLAGVVRRMERD